MLYTYREVGVVPFCLHLIDVTVRPFAPFTLHDIGGRKHNLCLAIWTGRGSEPHIRLWLS